MISVCMATYNGGPYIRTQLKSILEQLGEHDEVIISDDSSTDDTRSIINSFGDARVRLVDGPGTGSPIPNFEHALSLAKGEYIFLSDQDDKWMPGKVEAMLAELRKGYDCVVTDCIVTDGSLQMIHPSFYSINHTHRGRYFNLFVKNGYLGCCMAFTHQLLDIARPFPLKDIPMHDIWIGNVAAFYGKVSFIDGRFIYYRRSGRNATGTAFPSHNSYWKRFSMRWHVMMALLRIRHRVKTKR